MSFSFIAHAPLYKIARNKLLQLAGIAVLAIIGSGSFSCGAHAAAGPLTLAEAQRLALERSRQLSAQDHAVIASREMASAAGQLPDPVLKLGVDNLPLSGADRFS